jgi:hypothetical protein
MSKFNIPYLFNSLVLVLDEEGGTHAFESLKDMAKGLQPLKKKNTTIICYFTWINYHWVTHWMPKLQFFMMEKKRKIINL